MSKHIAVLKGGWSAEREVSLVTGHECAIALREAGYSVTEIDVDRNIAARLSTLKPDAVFNALHGRFGEDGNIQGLLNFMGIPYTHSGVLASAVAMDKVRAKQMFCKAGLTCPNGKVASREDLTDGQVMEPPYVIKPINEGSSIGVHIVKSGDNFNPVNGAWTFGDNVLVETFIPGRELTVGVLDGEAFCVTEITSERGFYDYEAKYAEGGSIHILPANLPASITAQAMDWAVQAYNVLDCRGVGRCDFRYDDTKSDPGDLYLLEINTQPGMTPTSLVPEQAAYVGISFPQLMARLVEDAQCDC